MLAAFSYSSQETHRRRGKRGGTAFRLKAGMDISASCSARPAWDVPLHVCLIRPIVPGSLDVPMVCLVPQIRRGGVQPQFLHPLNRGPPTESEPPLLRMALLNVQSLVNKIFILHDFFISRNLDFLFMMETWIKEGDSSLFPNLFLKTAHFLTLRDPLVVGGGLAAVSCIIPAVVYKSFDFPNVSNGHGKSGIVCCCLPTLTV